MSEKDNRKDYRENHGSQTPPLKIEVVRGRKHKVTSGGGQVRAASSTRWSWWGRESGGKAGSGPQVWSASPPPHLLSRAHAGRDHQREKMGAPERFCFSSLLLCFSLSFLPSSHPLVFLPSSQCHASGAQERMGEGVSRRPADWLS